jgi:chromosome segregation ATPase
MMPPDLQAHVESFWPTSVIGWLTAATLAVAVGKTAYDWLTGRRKSLAAMQEAIKAVDKKVEQLCTQIGDMEGELTAVDGLAESVRELTQEWRGVPGSGNGYRSVINKNTDRIGAIEKRNERIDAVRDEELRRGGGQQRRHMDRELNNLKSEEP